jgi:DnaK suppressor protein
MTGNKTSRHEKLKKILLDKKRKMWGDLREEYFVKLGKEYRDQFDNPQDLEDLSLLDLIEDTGLAVAHIRREELTRMDEALDRLEDGTYGLCAECGLEIDEGRLKVMPFAVFCVPCQKKKES